MPVAPRNPGTFQHLASRFRSALITRPTQQEGHMADSVFKRRIKIYTDSSDRAQIFELAKNPAISGFTTNPTLMRKAGVTDYRAFCRDILSVITDKPISFEVFADDFPNMHRQALDIASW